MTAPAFAEHGTPDAEAVVLLHGWPCGPHTWRRLAPMLAARFRVLVPELRDPDLRAQAAGVRDLLASLAVERYAAVGHAHGGGVAQLLAADGPAPAALVLLDPVAYDEAPPVDLDTRAFVRRGAVEVADLPEDDLVAYEAFDAPPPQPVDLTEAAVALGASEAPILLLWGEDDPFLPLALAERLGEALPGSTLGVVPSSGHLLLDDAFDPVGVMITEYLRVRYEGTPHGHDGIVRLQLERRPAWVDLAPYEEEDDEPMPPTSEQEVGPHA
jgi:pimeloyl-ACP methyl ester carboxylesterase